MTKEQINIAIAESLGKPPDEGLNYHVSLDACVEMLDTLSPYQRDLFASRLVHALTPHLINGERPEGVASPYLAWQGVFQVVTATAPQRCEAYLRTIGKWKETK